MKPTRLLLVCWAVWAWLSPAGASPEAALRQLPGSGLSRPASHRLERIHQAQPARAAFLDIAVTATQSPRTVLPGESGLLLLSISINNTYPNLLSGPMTLTSLRLTNATAGPGSVADRDAELGTVRLYRDNGDSVFNQPDVVVAQRTANGGTITFAPISASCPRDSVTRFYVVTDVPPVARDGDALDLSIQASSDVVFDTSASFSNAFPVAPAGSFTIDGMSAFQIGVGASGTSSLLAGTANNLVLNALVPANGYDADVLQQITVVNTGTAMSGADIVALKLWADDGDGSFAPASDPLLGTLAYTGGSRWQLTSLSAAIPKAGLRLFVSADLNDFAVEGRTVKLVLPTLPDLGIGVASANDGPIDRALGAPTERAVSTANRVTLTAPSVSAVTVRPGQSQVPLLRLAATNRYATPQVLDRLIVTNAGVGGTISDRDHAVQTLTLRLDGNNDGVLGDPLTDPPLGTAFFTDGQAAFSGLGYSLAGGASRGFFVTADVSLTGAADGDTLSALIAGSLDVSFSDTTRVLASWPLDSHARAGVDGMVAAQLGMTPPPAATLAPGDSNIVALDLRIPRNGHADDQLQGLQLINQGTANNTDIAEVRLWRDGGDGAFTPGAGDDVDLGVASWTGSGWQSPALTQALGAAGARLFAVLRIGGSATDAASVRLAVPALGVTVASGNDGPIDAAVASPTTLLISNSPLLASLTITPPASTAGQTIAVAMAVRNTGSESISGVAASPLTQTGAGTLTLATGPTPASLTLAPGATDTIRWTYSAATAGDVQLTGRAQGTGSPSGTPTTSLDATSNLHHVFDQATSLDAVMTASLPPTVNRGQAGVVPFTVRFSSSGGPQAAPVRLRALRIRLEDESGAGIVPDQLLARVSVNQGTTERLSRTTLESSGSEVDLTLMSPPVIHAGENVDLTLALDLIGATTVSAFRVSIQSAAWLVAEDTNTGAAVPVQLASGAFPVGTGLARVVEAPTRLDVVATSLPSRHAGPGQTAVPLLALRLSSAGTSGITNDVRLSSLAFDADDTTGVRLARLADVLGRLQVSTPFQILASSVVVAGDGASPVLLLSPPLNVPVNAPVDLVVSGDIAVAAGPGAFRLRLADSTRVDARDAISRDPVAVGMTMDPLPGPATTIESPAETLLVSGAPQMPAEVRAGDTNVLAMTIRLKHPGGPGTAPLRLDSLVFVSRDDSHQPLVPSQVLDRVRVLWNGVEVGAATNPPASGEATGVGLGRHLLAAGDSAVVAVMVDFAATAPEGFIELSLLGDGTFALDANLDTRAAVVPSLGTLPFSSGLAHLQAPARVLTVGLVSTMPASLAGDGRAVPAARLQLVNPSSAGAGDITVDHLVIHAGDRGYSALALGTLAEQVVARVNGGTWAQSASLTPDSTTATLLGATPLTFAPGAPQEIELTIVPRSGSSAGALRLRLDAADIGVVQPASALLQVQVTAAAGQAFPLWTEAGSMSPLDLAASYSNFPNPFAAGRQGTHFAYFLPGPGHAWLRVTTLAGDVVATLVNGEARSAGMHQDDHWDGRNGVGQTVRNGVYIAELTIQYDDGTHARVLRKVAAVR